MRRSLRRCSVHSQPPEATTIRCLWWAWPTLFLPGSSVEKDFPRIESFALATSTHPLEPLPRKKIKPNEKALLSHSECKRIPNVAVLQEHSTNFWARAGLPSSFPLFLFQPLGRRSISPPSPPTSLPCLSSLLFLGEIVSCSWSHMWQGLASSALNHFISIQGT